MSELEGSATDADLLKGLNEQQRLAVTAEPGNQLIIAGAGSGKTRVLVHRMAYLIRHFGYGPYELMAVTFTNKAARVMAGRVSALLDIETKFLWIGTFHGLANRMLRHNYELAKLPQHYTIIDAQDQRRLIERLMKENHMNTDQWKPKQAVAWISRVKDDGKRWHHIQMTANPQMRQRVDFYRIYDEYCHRAGYVDFGEILLRCHEMLLDNEALLEQYRQRFSEFLVDEFQDTNAIQYNWIRLLAGKQAHVLAVGDDDQSIYGWRGAVVGNIRSFEGDFANTKVIRLEQNYRSTSNILNAANHVIRNNDDRLGKELWTTASEGTQIAVVPCASDIDQADFVTKELKKWVAQEHARTFDHVAVLYRSHFQSRAIESMLNSYGISYTIRGGMRFYERAEIRDVIGYMQLLSQPDSDVGFDRAINAIPRGIGRESQMRLREVAAELRLSLWGAATTGIQLDMFPDRMAVKLKTFVDEVRGLAEQCKGQRLATIAEKCVHDSGVLNHYMNKERDDELRESRRENLQEFIRACGTFEEKFLHGDALDPDKSILQVFLDSVSLDSGDVEEDLGPSVSLMTLHAAKGLEYPLVFIIGMMEGRFPHFLSLEQEEELGLYEERRLAYVGMTRAMKDLYLLYTETDFDFRGGAKSVRPSRFIKEIPEDYLRYPKGSRSTGNLGSIRPARRRWRF